MTDQIKNKNQGQQGSQQHSQSTMPAGQHDNPGVDKNKAGSREFEGNRSMPGSSQDRSRRDQSSGGQGEKDRR